MSLGSPLHSFPVKLGAWKKCSPPIRISCMAQILSLSMLRFRLFQCSIVYQNTLRSLWLQNDRQFLFALRVLCRCVAMDAGCTSERKGLQSRITDYFNSLHVPLVEPESYCPFHQSLITDYFREISVSPVVSESDFYSRRSVSVLFESVLQELSYTVFSIPSSKPQTPMSKFVPTASTCTHVSETLEIKLARERAETLARHNNVKQEGCFVHRSLW